MDLVPELRCGAWGHEEGIIKKGEDGGGAVKFLPPLSLSVCAVKSQSRRHGDLCRKEAAAAAC